MDRKIKQHNYSFFLVVNSLSQGVIDVSSVGLLTADPPPAAQRHQLISRVGIFLQK